MKPVFAVIGHPNEGKSSVVSTLVEDDQIRISSRPGETVKACAYPVTLDGETVISFVDTPGFQNPVQTLDWMRDWMQREAGPPQTMLREFLEHFAHEPGMAHECALLGPVLDGAGIIYVLDASRPMRQTDRAEMEILRLTGRPRMALLNCKTGEEDFLEDWKAELRLHFNMVRTLNALHSTFAERMRLLESLRAMEQDWEEALDQVVDAFARDWKRRSAECAALACDCLCRIASLTVSLPRAETDAPAELEARLVRHLEDRVRDEERELHARICRLFRHDVRSFALPEQSVLRQDLFSRATWSVLGLSRSALTAAAAAAGSAAGLALDLATIGVSLGVFAAVGGATAGLAAFFQGERLTRTRILGVGLGQQRIEARLQGNAQWVFVLLDRFFLHFWYVANWSHAWRDVEQPPLQHDGQLGLSGTWPAQSKNLCIAFFRAAARKGATQPLEEKMRVFLEKELLQLTGHQKYPLFSAAADAPRDGWT